MNKATLVDKIMEVEEKRAKKLLANAKQVDELLNCLKDIVENDVLMKGETISLAGLFTISLAHKPATTCRNPQSGEPMTTKAYNYVKIRPSKQLRDYDLTVNVEELNKKPVVED
ncbi:MAG TPA: DNA-binding protein [Candidatus Atribacteria bacterium]|nr:DNA-binding protein [Candidatus Atribacteria bacterium]